MLIGRIQQFVETLTHSFTLSEDETHWLEEIRSHFLECDAASRLNHEGEAWILSCYNSRWQRIRHNPVREQLAHAAEIDKMWIQFATAITDESEQFFLGETDKTVHLVNELLEYSKLPLQTAQTLLLHPFVKNVTKRPLSIKELLRLRNKKFPFHVEDVTYQNLWDYLCNKIAPIWQHQEDNAWLLYPDLLTLIEHYQPEGANQLFKEKLNELNFNLINSPIEAAHYFYSLSFNIQGNKTYLFEILVDCWAGTEPVAEKLVEVLRALREKNPAWISTNALVQPLYKDLAVGAYFSLVRFSQSLTELNTGSSEIVLSGVRGLLEMLLSETKITPTMIEKLSSIYLFRWNEIIDTEQDYLFAPQDSLNQIWIKLAQNLAGAALIDSNYYRFLMPTLEQNLNQVLDVPITTFPLKAYILSDDNKRLIYLPHSVMHYRSKGTFYNCNDPENPVPLTSKEKERLLRVAPDSHEYFKLMNPKRTISKPTV